MVADSKKAEDHLCALRVPLQGGAEDIPRKVYKFSKQGRNKGQVVAAEKRDHTTYDYSDKM